MGGRHLIYHEKLWPWTQDEDTNLPTVLRSRVQNEEIGRLKYI